MSTTLTPRSPIAADRTDTMITAAPFIERQMKVWIQHVDDFGYTRTESDKMPRADTWRPYRFAVQDVILALTALRHAKALNCIEVDVFAASDPFYEKDEHIPKGRDRYPYEPLASHGALTLMILSEAFRVGTPMMVRFTNNVERSQEERDAGAKVGRVPFAILQLAEIHGTPVPVRESGVLGPEEAIPLYAALSGFPPGLGDRIDDLVEQGLLSIERACYLVQHGIWSVPELEGLIRGCPYPDLVLDGEIQPESRHLHAYAQSHARIALIGGVLDRALLVRDPSAPADGESVPVPQGRAKGAEVTEGESMGKDVEDDDRDLVIEFDSELTARRYRLGERETDRLPLPDWRPFSFREEPPVWTDGIGHDVTLLTLLRPREEADMKRSLSSDIAAAGEHTTREVQPAVLVPLDFNDMGLDEQAGFLEEAKARGVWLLVCPETTKNLDVFAREKLNRSRVLPE